MISNTLYTGLEGVRKGMEGAQRAAGEIARAGTVDPAGETAQAGAVRNLAEPLVDLKLYQRSFEASTKVVKTADDMLGTLLNQKA